MQPTHTRMQTAKTIILSICLATLVSSECNLSYANADNRSYQTDHDLHHFGEKENLSNSFIIDLCKDKKGTIWIATEDGLKSFDGISITNYQDSTGHINGKTLNAIMVDNYSPLIWIATANNGICNINIETQKLTSYTAKQNPDSLITNDITGLGQCSKNKIWASTYYNGLECFDKNTKKFTHFNSSTVDGMSDDPINTILVASDSTIYIGHYNKGLTILNPEKGKAKNISHAKDNELPSNKITCLYMDRYKRIWIGTDKGLGLLDSGTNRCTAINLSGEYKESCIHSILLQDDGTLLLGLEFKGNILIKPDEINLQASNMVNPTPFRKTNSPLRNTTIRCIVEDDYKNLWYGTYGDGLWFETNINKQKCRTMNASELICSNKISGLSFDLNNKLWIGTDGNGINVIQYNSKTHSFNDSSVHENITIGNNAITASYCDSNGDIWLGTYNGGGIVYRHSINQFQSIPYLDALDIRCYFEYGEYILVGSNNGIYVLEKGSLKIKEHITTSDGLKSNLIRSLCIDNRQNLWVGSLGSGICIFDRNLSKIKEINSWNSSICNNIRYILQDKKNNIWIGTAEGLVLIDADSLEIIKIYTTDDGLKNNSICAITEDKEGNIWFSTNTYISCIYGNKIYNYNYKDGTTVGNFKVSSVTQSRDGLICFGACYGLTYFYPEKMLKHEFVPATEIRRISFTNKASASSQAPETIEVCTNSKIRLDYKHNNFKVIFCVPDFSLENKLDYSYRLHGKSDEWYMTDDNHSVTFNHLSPGNYLLEVRAKMHNQDWEAPISSLCITINPPLWLTWWAKLTYVFLAGILIATATLLYIRSAKRKTMLKYEWESMLNKQAINDERLRFYINITHELRTPFTLILGPLEDLLKENSIDDKIYNKINLASKNAKKLFNIINQLLDFQKTEAKQMFLTVTYGEISQVVNGIGLLFKEANQNSTRQIILDIEPQVYTYYDNKVITSILNNLLSNALKYTPNGSITLFLKPLSNNQIKLGVKDTGYGIKEYALPHIFETYYQANDEHQAPGTGIGLALVKKLVILHEGSIEVESKVNEGTVFSIYLNADNKYPSAKHITDTPYIGKDVINKDERDNDKLPIILVIDDNADIRNYIYESLSNNYNIITAVDGRNGIDLARERIPDVIICDVMMPGLSGFDLCTQIKQDISTSHIPIILLTAKDTEADKTLGYDLGADSYITKPFSTSLLTSRVHNLIQSRKNLAAIILSNNHKQTTEEAPGLRPLDHDFLSRITELIESNISSENMDVSYIADHMNMSQSTLYRKIKGLLGISTNEYIRKTKLRHAARLLDSGQYTISEVMWQVGINSSIYFRKCFKEEFGVSPSEYKKNGPHTDMSESTDQEV